jgi:hypothetical protein
VRRERSESAEESRVRYGVDSRSAPVPDEAQNTARADTAKRPKARKYWLGLEGVFMGMNMRG